MNTDKNTDKNTEKNKSGVETHFNRKYRQFDSFYDEKKDPISRLIDRWFRRSMQLRFEKVIAAVAPYSNKTVLDVGCGAGRYAVTLARKGITTALGIDFAENMILEAQQLARHYQVEHITRFERADFMHLDIPQPFHHVYAMGVMDYVLEPIPFVAKMIRSAKTSVMLSFPCAGGFIQSCRKLYFFKIKKCPVYFYSHSSIEQLARQAGATEFTIDKLAKDYFLEIHIATDKK